MSLTSKTKDIVKHFDFKFSKSLGQNFLIDNNILLKIMDGAELDENSCAIEIGPGIGTLTQELCKRCRKVIAIELDDSLIPILDETLGNYSNVKVIKGDALKLDFNKLIEEEELENVKVVANLPYYVTTPIITKLLTDRVKISDLVVMIQKEVGERIDAKANTKEYGSLSLLCSYFADTSKVCKVSPKCFMPEPKVESIVIRLKVLGAPRVKVMDEKLFFSVIRDAFNMRRKTLWNALKPLGFEGEKMQKAFELSGINQIRRGETLTIEEFAKLSDALSSVR